MYRGRYLKWCARVEKPKKNKAQFYIIGTKSLNGTSILLPQDLIERDWLQSYTDFSDLHFDFYIHFHWNGVQCCNSVQLVIGQLK